MQIAPGIFKAYDIRGIYPTELNEEGAYAIGRAFVTFLQAREVIVGHDMRLSGPAIFDAVTRGIMDQGADVVNIGLVSTDQYYFACTRLGLPGMMVTASHNPKQYNGFKMVPQMPYLLSGAEGIQDLRRIVENDAYAPTTRTGGMRALDLSDEFVTFVLGLIDSDMLERRRLKSSPIPAMAQSDPSSSACTDVCRSILLECISNQTAIYRTTVLTR
jgi:phosphomannomutase (EC 5.4.2.8)